MKTNNCPTFGTVFYAKTPQAKIFLKHAIQIAGEKYHDFDSLVIVGKNDIKQFKRAHKNIILKNKQTERTNFQQYRHNKELYMKMNTESLLNNIDSLKDLHGSYVKKAIEIDEDYIKPLQTMLKEKLGL